MEGGILACSGDFLVPRGSWYVVQSKSGVQTHRYPSCGSALASHTTFISCTVNLQKCFYLEAGVKIVAEGTCCDGHLAFSFFFFSHFSSLF